jgi:wyosine [tRNA(Phe)-imidazoG37] synthetase (radical SAM superfamily)
LRRRRGKALRKNYKYIYGPVASWRLGSSLGVDPISHRRKACTFDCVYCQIGRTRQFSAKRKIFVPTEKIIEEIKSLPPAKIDYITFSGAGEPTLAKNLGELIKRVKEITGAKVAVLTNSSLMYRKDVREDLRSADFVAAKLDASCEKIFRAVSRPMRGTNFKKIIKAMRDFKRGYKGKFALQIMFVKANKRDAARIAALARGIAPDEVEINTPLRPSAVRPLSKKEIAEISKLFKGMNVIDVYKTKRKKVAPISPKSTMRRRGKRA